MAVSSRYAQTPSSLIVVVQCLITLFYCVLVQDHITVSCHNCSIILLISRSCFRMKSVMIKWFLSSYWTFWNPLNSTAYVVEEMLLLLLLSCALLLHCGAASLSFVSCIFHRHCVFMSVYKKKPGYYFLLSQIKEVLFMLYYCMCACALWVWVYLYF